MQGCPRPIPARFLLPLLVALAALGCTDAVAHADQPIAAHRGELLDLAFRAASAFPVQPHVKNRSRAQDQVVAACLELAQPHRALQFLEQIDNWRRGAAYADLALYCVERGDLQNMRRYLHHASRLADVVMEDPNEQAWRRDRIRAKIASVHIRLGESGQARRFTVDLASSEIGTVDLAVTRKLAAADLDAQIERLRAGFGTGDFELCRNALAICAELFDRFYGDERRVRIEALVDGAEKMPQDLRIDALARMGEAAFRHRDHDKARALVDKARALLDAVRWTPEHFTPMAARLAALRHRAGEPQRGRQEAEQALALYQARRADIVDIHRAGALRPIAEAFQSMGHHATALMVYRLAVEEGVENPNSRPRADDLVATCCSLARSGAEPDAALHARLREICAGLGNPW